MNETLLNWTSAGDYSPARWDLTDDPRNWSNAEISTTERCVLRSLRGVPPAEECVARLEIVLQRLSQPEVGGMSDWIRIVTFDPQTWPPEDEVVYTKIHDEKGCRNVGQLKRISNLFVYPDGSGYVYYTPTHWKR